MPCNPIKDSTGRVIGFACSRGRRSTDRCLYCGRTGAELLCDHDLGDGKTCDRKLCRACAVHVGPNRYLCPDHA